MIRMIGAMWLALAMGMFATALAQEPGTPPEAQVALDPGVPLKAPKNGTLSALSPIGKVLVGWEAKKKWGLERGDAVPFHYARYTVSADTKVKKGTARAGTDLYGIYYKSANGASKRDGDWVVKPEWSGLFPLNTDQMLVRAPGTETWYVLRLSNGKLKQLGDGEIAITHIVDEEVTDLVNLYGDELYYLVTADNGTSQTIRLLSWNAFEQEFSLRAPIDNVVPAATLGEPPVKVTMHQDFFVRRYKADGSAYDFVVVSDPASTKNVQPRVASTLEVTYPFKQSMYVLDAEKQLYLPVEDETSLSAMRNAQENNPDFLGVRPVGLGVTAGTREHPLEAYKDGFMVAVWNTPKGERLAVLKPDWRSYMYSIDTWSAAYKPERSTYYFNYLNPHHAAASKSWAAYSEIYPIYIPDEVRNDPDPELAIYSGIYCVGPDGTVDVNVVQAGFADGWYFRANPERLEDMDAAREFVAQAMTVEGRRAVHAHLGKLIADKQDRIAASELRKKEAEQAAIVARREAQEKALEAKHGEIKSLLARGDYYGALDLAYIEPRFLPEAIKATMDAGYENLVTLEMAESCMYWADNWQAAYCGNRIWKLKPPSNRTVQYGPAYSGSSGSSAASADTSQYDIMEAARQSSRDAYNSGNTGSYLCGSGQSCN
ncbi:hypothetical protein [Hyphomonas chukchiensis]|uniref:hypothetical protein n=1 Tax=Hyphomonas chukchiensis TaxID=1280947 RepID=UPI0030FB4E1E